jgi:hypothetical protein
LIDLLSMFYPLFSLSELPDRFLGYNLSLLRHPLRLSITYEAMYNKIKLDEMFKSKK